MRDLGETDYFSMIRDACLNRFRVFDLDKRMRIE